ARTPAHEPARGRGDVAMRAELGGRAVFVDQGMSYGFFMDVNQLGGAFFQRKKERRNFGRRTEHVGLEVVARSEGRDAAPGGEALVFRFLERQPADPGEQAGFVFPRQKLFLVQQPFRHPAPILARGEPPSETRGLESWSA